VFLAVVLSVGFAVAADLEYQRPAPEIAELIEAPLFPGVSVSPDRNWLLLLNQAGYPSIEEVAQPELRLAGERISPNNHGPSRAWYYNGLMFQNVSNGERTLVKDIPEGARIDRVRYSPNGKQVSFCVTASDGITLWTVPLGGDKARQVSALKLNATLSTPYRWLADNKSFVALTVPGDMGDVPVAPLAPDGPVVQESIGRKAPARTYQDLLENPHDEDLFDYYMTSQAVLLTLDGEVTPLGKPAVYNQVAASPDGKYLLVDIVHRPYSYQVPADRFPHREEVWDMTGKVIYVVADLPLADDIPIAYGSVPTGRREISWRNDALATLAWVEALDGGDAGAEAEVRDQLYLQDAPFDKDPVEWLTLEFRIGGINWGTDKLAIVSEWWWPTRTARAWFAAPGTPKAEPSLWIERNWQDRYSDPGSPMMEDNEYGFPALLTADGGKTLFLSGDGASDEGDRPFLDEFNLTDRTTRRLFRSEAPYYESPVAFLDVDKRVLITRREAIEEPPNYYRRDLKKDKLTALTEFPHPTPGLLGISKELIKYKRDDSLDLTGTLYLPKGYDPEKDGPLPTILWAYPEEYKSADAAGQVQGSPYRFVRVFWASPLLWLNRGYAVLDDPSMPIVGEGDTEPNDTFREQLVAGAKAAIDELVRRGVCDPERVAVGGHSYGAFMTANLLAHSDLFRAGIARSGAYNRTLTPFGFQSEERTFWEAPEVYFDMSPFMHADKIDEPILLIHGEADNNSGTFPLQSERFYAALKGLGATARLVMLPHESHSYRAMESILHQAWEIDQWLDKYVKNAEPRELMKTENKETGGK